MFSLDFLVDHFQVYLLLLLRLSGFIFTAPIFGERYIPPQVKVVLSLLLALFFYVFAVPQGAQLIDQPLPYWVLLIKEVVWGFLIGFACQLVFIGVQFSGQITGFQMGFGVVNVIDPQSGGQVSIISRLQYLLAVLIFLAMDGHHFLLQALASSFDLLPLGQIEFASAAGERLLRGRISYRCQNSCPGDGFTVTYICSPGHLSQNRPPDERLHCGFPFENRHRDDSISLFASRLLLSVK